MRPTSPRSGPSEAGNRHKDDAGAYLDALGTVPLLFADDEIRLARHIEAGQPREALVVDPSVGGGQTAVAAHRAQLRFLGGDINHRALRLTAARITAREGCR